MRAHTKIDLPLLCSVCELPLYSFRDMCCLLLLASLSLSLSLLARTNPKGCHCAEIVLLKEPLAFGILCSRAQKPRCCTVGHEWVAHGRIETPRISNIICSIHSLIPTRIFHYSRGALFYFPMAIDREPPFPLSLLFLIPLRTHTLNARTLILILVHSWISSLNISRAASL